VNNRALVQSKAATLDEEHAGALRRTAVDWRLLGAMSLTVHEVLRSSGQPLDAATRAAMETRFGHDFSGVRVHADSRAAESARAVNALAYTVGNDIAFGTGQYMPGTERGKRVLAHELAHVVQQAGNQTRIPEPSAVPLKMLPPAHSLEYEAERTAEDVTARGLPPQRTDSALSAVRAGTVHLARIVRANPYGTGPASAQVPDLEEETVQKVKAAIAAGNRQQAIDLIVRDAANSGAIDLDLIDRLTAIYDPNLSEEGRTQDPVRDREGRLQPAVVKIGPKAFDHGVPWLYSTIRHEYVHVQQGRPISESQPVRVHKTAADPRSHGQEVEAYAYEILNADRTGVKASPSLIVELWNRLRLEWIQVLPLLQRSLRDLADRAFDVAKKIVGKTAVLTPL
jgi:hypothetical protein